MSRDIVVESPWPRLSVDLANFVTDSSLLLDTHRRWLADNVAWLLKYDARVEMRLVGGASRVGDARWNQELSEARIEAVLNEVRGYAMAGERMHCPPDPQHRDPSGERLATGRSSGANLGRSRAVGLQVWPLSLSPYPATRSSNVPQARAAFERVKTTFRTIASASFPLGFRGMPLQGEGLLAAWEPVRAEMDGFGQTIRNLVQGPVCQDLKHPHMYFLNAVSLNATGSAAAAPTRGAARRVGAEKALRIWNALQPDGRWGLKNPDVEHQLRREMCGLFREAFERCFGGSDRFGGSDPGTYPMRWSVGMSDFYDEDEERHDPPR